MDKHSITMNDIVKYSKAATINPDTLSAEMAQHPAIFGQVAIKTAFLRAKVRKLETGLKLMEAELNQTLRNDPNRTAKITEEGLKNEVKTDARFVAATQELQEHSGVLIIAEALVETMRQRGDMLISCGAQWRHENREIHINK